MLDGEWHCTSARTEKEEEKEDLDVNEMQWRGKGEEKATTSKSGEFKKVE